MSEHSTPQIGTYELDGIVIARPHESFLFEIEQIKSAEFL